MAGLIGIDKVKTWHEETTDCNSATRFTIYNVRNTTLNIPSGMGAIGLMLVLADASGFVFQQILIDSDNRMYIRVTNNAGILWEEWKEVATK